MATDKLKQLYFIAFCMEQYKNAYGLSGAEVSELFNKSGVTKYLTDNYEALHTQGANWLINDIEDFINKK